MVTEVEEKYVESEELGQYDNGVCNFFSQLLIIVNKFPTIK